MDKSRSVEARGVSSLELGLLIALVLYAIQIAWSRYWLSHFRMGPMEWVWRSATYGRPQPLVSAAPVAPQPV